MIYDCLIIGHGPAGITAAKYLKRANKNIIAIGKDLGVLASKNIIIDNYYGHHTVTGDIIANNAFMHAKDLGIAMITDEVLDIAYDDHGYLITTIKNQFVSKTVLLATGAKRTTINIPGFSKYSGLGISHCATCDGFFYKDKKIALIGAKNYMLHELATLENITEHITVFTNGEILLNPITFPVITDKITAISGDSEKVTGIIVNNITYDVDGIFVAIGTASALDFAQKMGVIIEKGHIAVDESLMTNIAGIFAAGDAIGGKMQIIKSSHDGMIAAHSIIDYLKLKKDNN